MTVAGLTPTLIAQPESSPPAATSAPALPPPLTPGAPLADPVVRADAELTAQRATAWGDDAASHLLLVGDFRLRVGAYGFRGERAVVRIDRIDQPGYTVRHLSLYIEDARPLMGTGPIEAEAQRLLVTVSTRGAVTLETDLFDRVEQTPQEPLVQDAAARIARHRQGLNATQLAAAPDAPLYAPRPQASAEATGEEPDASVPMEAPTQAAADAPADTTEPSTPPAEPVLPTRGAVYLTADSIVGEPRQNAVMLVGDVRVVYESYDGEVERDVALTAERAVIFTRPREDGGEEGASAAGAGLAAGEIAGVYLEDNAVITDGRYTVRAPRMYFDLEQNKAILLDAVMYTWDFRRQIPLYLRADVVKQESATSLVAENALLTTSEFAEPHFAIATDRVTIQRMTEEEGGSIESFSASGNLIEVQGVPVFYWPFIAGLNRQAPLRSASIGGSSQNGVSVETTWDVFALAGRPRPEGVDLLARIDYQGDHGPAVGLVGDYERERFFGGFESYFLPNDNGTDEIANRRDVEQDGETRGFLRWQHRQYLEQDWELSLEASYVSDPTFLEEFFRDEAWATREYETSAHLKKQQDDWAFTFLGKYDLNDFAPQLTTLQTPGYSVDKLPELGYHRIGTSLFEDRLTYFGENRLGYLRLRPGEDDPADRGFSPFLSGFIFGMAPTTSYEDLADNQGYPLDWTGRLDSRHELNLPMEAGFFDLTPYVAGRFTGYTEDFEGYRGSDETDQIRLWGQVGVRASTEFARSYGDVENRLLDVHRLRHIVRPSAHAFATGTTLDSGDLPVYDWGVEGINDASGVRLGLTNTLQTQRGGPGRWRSVDWIVLQTDLVFQNNTDATNLYGNDPSIVSRFFDYRPEFSTGGDHFYTQLLWLVTDTFGITGELTHSFDTGDVVQWRLGASLQHTPRLGSFVHYQELDVFGIDSQLLTYGFNYVLTEKYSVQFRQRISFTGEGANRYSLGVTRRLPRWLLQLVGSYDQIDDETTLGLVLVPEGFRIRSPVLPIDSFLSPF